jgi:hypothetical protein
MGMMDMESDQEMNARTERADLIEAIRMGLAAAKRGEMKSAEQVFAEMRVKCQRRVDAIPAGPPTKQRTGAD